MQAEKGHFSIPEYLNLLEQSDERLEYHNGKLKTISSSTINHAIISSNINSEIHNAVKDISNAISFNGQVFIYIEAANSFLFPDGLLVCGGIQAHEKHKHAIVNPKLVIEVFSKSTQGYDRGDKFHKYCSLNSFCEYVLIDQYQPVIDTLFRAEKGLWQMRTTIGLEQSIYLLMCTPIFDRIG